MSVMNVLRGSRPRVTEVKISSGVVYVRSLSGGERHAMRTSKEPATDIFFAGLALCESNGTKMFQTPEAGFNELVQMDGADLALIAHEVLKASGLIKDKEDPENPSTASPN